MCSDLREHVPDPMTPITSGIVDGGEMACAAFTVKDTFQPRKHGHDTSFLCVDTQHTAVGAVVDRQGRIVCQILGTTDEAGNFTGTYCGLAVTP